MENSFQKKTTESRNLLHRLPFQKCGHFPESLNRYVGVFLFHPRYLFHSTYLGCPRRKFVLG